MATINIELTKKGFPALWEEGGGAARTGHAIIVAGTQGEPLKPVYVRTGGPLSQGQHALFVVRRGYHIVTCSRWGNEYNIEVWRITKIDVAKKQAKVELICAYAQGEWDQEPPASLVAAIEAAREKSSCYHCRTPHYYDP
jgi:hypothetical protein